MADSKDKKDSGMLEAFLPAIGCCFAIVIALFYGVKNISATYTKEKDLKSQYEQKAKDVEDAKANLEKLKQAQSNENAKESAAEKSEKQFYKPIESGLATESVIIGEFAEILQLIRANKIKVRSIDYKPDPDDDNFVKNAGSLYNVERMSMEMVADYASFDNLLKELYKHDHFMDIESVEIVPYRKNKKILLINCKLKLYAKKS